MYTVLCMHIMRECFWDNVMGTVMGVVTEPLQDIIIYLVEVLAVYISDIYCYLFTFINYIKLSLNRGSSFYKDLILD